MTKLKLLSAAALLATMVTGSAMAQDVPATAQVVNQRHGGAYAENYDPDSRNLYAEREAHNDLSGPLCVPGATTLGEDGLTHRCQ
jgi:hypothetical protein